MVVSKELVEKTVQYLEDARYEFEDGDINEAIDAIKECEGGRINGIDMDVITRMIDDDELINELEKEKVVEEGNAFDGVKY